MANYYKHTFKGQIIDPYRICIIYNITHPAHQQALKKLLRAGRGTKDLEQDIDESIEALIRWKAMLDEDESDTDVAKMAKSEVEEVMNINYGPPNLNVPPGTLLKTKV